jgi:hypothetical protein
MSKKHKVAVMTHPADETNKEQFINGYIPAIGSLIILVVSILLDINLPGFHWTQRSGSIIIILGAYVAYIDVKRSMKFLNGHMYIHNELPYKIIAVTLIVIGTLVSGYADLLL